MGCDGGTIPRRDELVRTKKKPEQKDKEAERNFRWRHCALTQQKLQQPIVMCTLGRLYSKQSVIEHILEKDMPESAKHIKSLKDVKQLNLTPNPAYVERETNNATVGSCAPYICKLTGIEMSGNFRFMALWTCGCVTSERAFKQIKGNICALCQKPFAIEDVIALNGNDDDIEMMQAKKEMRAAKAKQLKKAKNKIAEIINEEELVDEQPSTSKDAAVVVDNVEKIVQTDDKKKPLSAKRPQGAANDALTDPELKRLKTDYSVAKDPKATDVYKSLFTTHQSEKAQTRAHWVTYNPFYN